jgi:hypothetical protein
MEEVRQRFVADLEEYVEDMRSAAGDARAFGDANAEAKEMIDGLRDTAAEAGEAVGDLRDSSAEAREATDELRDGALEAAEALGRLRDEAIEATEALHAVRDAEVEAGGAGAAEGGEGIGLMAFAIAGLIGLAAAVAPALLAAGGGIGAFALFAYPAISQVTGALSDTKAQLAKLPAPIRTVVNEVKNLEAQWKGISAQFTMPVVQMMSQVLDIASDVLPKLVPLARAGAAAVGQLLDQLGRTVDSKGFTDFLGMLTKLAGPATAAIGRLAGTVLSILGGAITQLAPISVPFVKMLDALLKAAGPALINALVFLAQAAMDIGRALTPLMGPLGALIGFMDRHPIVAQMAAALVGVAVAMKAISLAQSAIGVLAGSPWILALAALVIIGLEIYDHWHQIAHLFDEVRHSVAEAGHTVAVWFDRLRRDIAQWADDARRDFDRFIGYVEEIPHDIEHVFDEIRTTVTRIVGGIISWIASHWREIVAWFVDPVGMIVDEIRTHTHQIAETFDRLRHDVAAIADGTGHDIATAWDDARHDVAAVVDGIRHDIASKFDDARHDVAAFADWLPHEIASKFDDARHDAAAAVDGARHDLATAWDGIRHDVATAIDDVVGWFERLPGEILRDLEALPGEMLAVGRNVILGLIHGIESAAADIPGIMKSLAGDVESYFTDPLKIFSPSLVMFEHGWNIVQGAINGVKANAPQLLAAMRELGTGVGGAGIGGVGAYPAIGSAAATGGAYGGAAGAARPVVNININGGTAATADARQLQELQEMMQEAFARWSLQNPGTGFGIPGRG